jgi:hypothetical protein
MIKKLTLAATFAALGLATSANATGRFELGVLDCSIDGGTSYVVTSNKGVSCTFKPSNGGPSEIYTGVISKLGVDLGSTHQGQLVWSVLAASRDYDSGNLAGSYYGVNAEASVVTGGGANLLLGGFQRSYALQPLSVQAQTGLNVAVAVTSLELMHSLK